MNHNNNSGVAIWKSCTKAIAHEGEAPADKLFGAYWSQKVQLWWQQFLSILLRTNVIFHWRI